MRRVSSQLQKAFLINQNGYVRDAVFPLLASQIFVVLVANRQLLLLQLLLLLRRRLHLQRKPLQPLQRLNPQSLHKRSTRPRVHPVHPSLILEAASALVEPL